MARTAPNIRTRSEVDDIPGDAPVAAPAAQAAAPAATPAASSGTLPRSSQAELEAQLAAIAPSGDGSKLRHTAEVVTKQVPNPAAKLKPGEIGWVPGAPPTIPQQVLVHSWINDATGDTVKAETQDDGSYVVTKSGDTKASPAATARPPVAKQAKSVTIDTNPATGKQSQKTVWDDGSVTYDDTQVPASATAQAKPPEEKDENGRHWIWQPNPGGPDKGGQWFNAGPAEAKYVSQEVPVNGQRHLVVTATVPGQPPTQTFYGPDGKPETALPTEAPGYAARDEVVNGKHYTVITTTPKDGSAAPKVEWHDPDGNVVAAPTEAGKEATTDVTRNGTTYIKHSKANPDGTGDTWFTDQAGNRVQLPDDASANPFASLPDGISFHPDPNAEGYGLIALHQQLDAWVAKQGNTPEARQRAAAVLKQAGAEAESERQRFNEQASRSQAQRGQDITQRGQTLQDVEGRRNSADKEFSDVNSTVGKYGATLIPSGTSGQTVVDAYRAMLDMAHDNATAAGGYRDVPEIAASSQMGAPGADSTQVVMHPGGAITVSPVGSPAPTAPAAPAPAPAPAPDATNPPSSDAGPTVAGAPAVGPGPSSGPTGWDFSPTGSGDAAPQSSGAPGDNRVASLIDFGLSPTEAQNAVALYDRGVRAEHLS